MRRITIFIAVAVFSLAMGFGLGRLNMTSGTNVFSEIREGKESAYQFVNPLLECEAGEQLSDKKVQAVKQVVAAGIQDEITKDKHAHYIAVYYRNLNSGAVFSINGNDAFHPASLLKVPTLMALLLEAREKPNILNNKVLYEGGAPAIDVHFKPEKQIQKGQTYTIGELAEYMIRYSDNNAALLIAQILGAAKLNQVYTDLDVVPPSKNSEDEFMSVRDYASFFRMLYNASYLNKDASEGALQLLSETQFDGGLVAGVPLSIKVAHKFGESRTSTSEVQLHDCGIIYNPEKPYLLCIMTRGDDYENLLLTIKDISHLVYQEVLRADR